MDRIILGLTLLAPTLSCVLFNPDHHTSRLHSPVPEMKSQITQVVLLGTGTPNAEPDRSGSALAIVVNGIPYLIDCGPGIVRRATAAHAAGVEGLAVENLCRLFITHLHSDHTLGYPDLIFTPWVLERKAPLQAYGPRGLVHMTDHLLAAYEEDIHIRTRGLENANTVGYQVEVHEIEPGLIYEDENVKVTAFPVIHGNWKEAYGFRFETPDRTIVISGDTMPCPALVEAARGCDILIHEVYAHAGFVIRPEGWQKYHARFHTSSLELAALVREIKPGLLILYHQLYWGATDQQLLEEISRNYEGRVCSGRDLDLF